MIDLFWKRQRWLWLISLLIYTNALLAQQPEDSEHTKAKAPAAIPVTEIADRAKDERIILNKIRAELDTLPAIAAIGEEIPFFLDSLNTLRSDSIYNNLSKQSIRRLQNLSQEWTQYLAKLNTWENVLLERSKELKEMYTELAEKIQQWEVTHAKTVEAEVPDAIQERVKILVEEIKEVKSELGKRLEWVLTLQDQITGQQLKITETMAMINTAEAQLRSQLFVRDSPPLWEALMAEEDTVGFGGQIQESWKVFWGGNRAFIEANKDRFYLHWFVFAILLGTMIYFYRRNKRAGLLQEDDQTLKASAYFVSRPFSAALLIALFFSIWIYPTLTVTVRELVLLLAMITIVRLLPGMVAPELHTRILTMAGLYVLVIIQEIVASNALLQRLLLLLIAITALFVLWRILKPGAPAYMMKLKPLGRFLVKIGPLILALLLSGVLANLIGSVSLAHVLTTGIVGIIMLAVIFAAIAQILSGLVALLIRRRRTQSLHLVKTYAEQLERRATFFIHAIAILLWLRSSLITFGVYQPLKNWVGNILDYKWTVGTIEITVQGIVDFLLILVFAFILARVIRVFLELEVFSRIRFPRGIAGAISMVVRYTIVGLGIFLAISALGVDLGKFALLAGALGVGLGFGLQNIIANFVSGLILAFERPIQVGDIVEIGSVMGNVQEIGVRSSTVKTFDGSEVIVPNADLISNQVTNWTLSDARRRMQLPVKVAFGNDPHQVLELLLNVAREHPGVLKTPEPFATFNGFGDYYLDFTLYYWISENILQYKTEVALGVHDAIKAAGINTPRPQQDLNLKVIENLEKKRISRKKKSDE